MIGKVSRSGDFGKIVSYVLDKDGAELLALPNLAFEDAHLIAVEMEAVAAQAALRELPAEAWHAPRFTGGSVPLPAASRERQDEGVASGPRRRRRRRRVSRERDRDDDDRGWGR